MAHRRLHGTLILTYMLWLGTALHGHGFCGVARADALNDDLDDHAQDCVSCPLSQTPESLPPNTPLETPTVIPAIPISPLEAIVPTSIHVAACADGAVQYAHRRGPTRHTLVFIDRTAEGLADVPTTAHVMAVCVGCQLRDLRHLQERFPGQPLHLAPSGLIQQLGVSCVPTIVELSPTATVEQVP